MNCSKCDNVMAPGDVFCGNCGHKQSAEAPPVVPPPLPHRDAPRKPRTLLGILIIAAFILVLAALLLAGASTWFYLRRAPASGEKTLASPAAKTEAKSDYTVSAVDFLAEFTRDEAAAMAKYRGKWVAVSGWVSTYETTDDHHFATSITLTSWCFDRVLFFKLNREEMDKRYLFLEYFAHWRMMGRFTGIEGNKFLFEQSLLATSAPDYPPLPIEVETDVSAVVNTIHDSDPLVRAKLVGRKIQVTGIVNEVRNGQGSWSVITLTGGSNADKLFCVVPSSKLSNFNQGEAVTVKGWLTWRFMDLLEMALEVCFDEPALAAAPASEAAPTPTAEPFPGPP